MWLTDWLRYRFCAHRWVDGERQWMYRKMDVWGHPQEHYIAYGSGVSVYHFAAVTVITRVCAKCGRYDQTVLQGFLPGAEVEPWKYGPLRSDAP